MSHLVAVTAAVCCFDLDLFRLPFPLLTVLLATPPRSGGSRWGGGDDEGTISTRRAAEE